jgi:chaperonin GroES
LLKPVFNNVVVSQIKAEKSHGGIFLPEDETSPILRGRVLSVGPGQRLKDGQFATMIVQEDDIVIYNGLMSSVVYHEGKEYHVVRETDILAVDES